MFQTSSISNRFVGKTVYGKKKNFGSAVVMQNAGFG